MNTLYDVLGIGKLANSSQIDQAYHSSLEPLCVDSTDERYERDVLRAKVIKEAYSVLSSPTRRKFYDEKLAAKDQVVYEVVEKKPFPWLPALLVLAICGGGWAYYQDQQHKLELERTALEAVSAKAALDLAAKQAEAEQARLDQMAIDEQRRQDAMQRSEQSQARMEGQQISNDMKRFDAQMAREKAQADAQRARDDAQARIRTQQQLLNLQRAINMR